MIARRNVVGGGIAAGLAALAPGGAEGGEQGSEAHEVVRAIDQLRQAIERQQASCELGPCAVVDQIRVQQRVFLKANQKFPDYIDVGIDAWEAVYDWHVRNRQPLTITRVPEGRYGLGFMFTTVVLRPEQTPNYIGWGYDAR